MSECERLWDARAKAWGMNVIIGKLQKWSSPTHPQKVINQRPHQTPHSHPILLLLKAVRPTSPPSRLSDRVLKPCHHIFSSRAPSIMANCPQHAMPPRPNPFKALSFSFLFSKPNVNRNPRCKIERDWNPKPRERCCVNECICVAPERVLIYLTLLIQALFITYRHYRLVHYSHPSYIPCVQFNRWWSCNELPCATNCLFRASTQWWSE